MKANPCTMKLSGIIVAAIVLSLGLPRSGLASESFDTAPGWLLEREGITWTIDKKTGCIARAQRGELRLLNKSYDEYRLPTVGNFFQGLEKDDKVIDVDAGGLPHKLVVRCANEKLKLTIEKTYFFEEEQGWFCKRTSIGGPDQEKGFVMLSTRVVFPGAMWRDAVLHHPGGHGPTLTNHLTKRVDGPLDFRSADSTGMMCLSNFAHDLTLATVRILSNDRPVWWHFQPKFNGHWTRDADGNAIEYKVPGIDEMWTVAEPGRWRMPVLYGPVGDQLKKPTAVTVAYPVTPGNYADLQAAYVKRPAIREMLNHESQATPAWVRDVVLENWQDSAIEPQYNDTIIGETWKRVLDKMWFGCVVLVNYTYEIYTWNYPATEEGWRNSTVTVSRNSPAMPAHSPEWYREHGVDPSPYIVEDHEDYFVTRNPRRPAEFVHSVETLKAASGNHERFKVGDYSHIGHVGFDRTAPFLEEHPDAIPHRRDGEIYGNAADYSADPLYPIGVSVDNSHPAVQAFWLACLAERLEHFPIDFVYIDGFAANSSFADWKGHTAPQAEEVVPMYRGFLDLCREAELPLFHNSAYAVYNDIGYTEGNWFAAWQSDWRGWSSRMLNQGAMNPRGRPLIPIGYWDNNEYAGGPMNAPSAPQRLFAPIMWNTRMGMNNFSHRQPVNQEVFLRQGLPWIQAGFELRMRTYASPDLRPRWWAYETEVEGFSYNLGKSGVIAMMNHHPDESRHGFRFEPLGFDGLQAGRPAWLWRIDVPHPHRTAYDGVTHTSPIRRLATQQVISFYPELPEAIEYEGEFPLKTPVVLLLTQVPGLVESVDGKRCQLLLPENYEARITGVCDPGAGTITVTVDSRHETTTCLVPCLDPATKHDIVRRSLTGMHVAGVLPAPEDVEADKVELHGATFLRLTAGKGATEFSILSGKP